MKKYMVALAGVCALAALASATLNNGVDMEKMKKEIRVFENIVRTTFEDDQSRKDERLHPNEMSAIYLDGQGVMLDVNVGHGRFGFEMPLMGLIDFDMEPVLAQIGEIDGAQIEVDTEEIEQAFEEASRALEESEMAFDGEGVGDDVRVKLKELAKERAKLMQEVHEKRREAFKRMREEKALSEADRKRMEEQAKVLADRIQTSSKSIRARMDKLRTESDQQWGARIKPFVDSFLETVCEYGAGIKSLPADERLTIVFRNADRSEGQSRDLVYVFTKKDLLACRDGQLSAAELKSRSVHYSY